jgi:hypothetical protein
MTPAWSRRSCLGACLTIVRGGADCRRSVRGRTGLQAADGDDLLPGPDLKREGAADAAYNNEGAVVQRLERRHGAAAVDPDEAGGEELGWQLAGQVKTGAGIVPRQRISRSCLALCYNCYVEILVSSIPLCLWW